jgi:hypothetical protein
MFVAATLLVAGVSSSVVYVATSSSTPSVKVCVLANSGVVVSGTSKGKCPAGSKLTVLKAGTVIGSPGPQGPAGSTGPQGSTGPAGATGPQGSPGPVATAMATATETPSVLDGGAP